MGTTNTTSTGAMQVWHFVLHLRWHYQLFILSGGFILGGFLSPVLHFQWFIIQFLNVQLLLFGGATAYNSYWDRDIGPIGGLKHPPKMTRWMWAASLIIQMLGLLLAIPLGRLFLSFYALSMLLFWLYSSPIARWKGRPLKSLLAIGISTGFDSVLLGYLAAGNRTIPVFILIAGVGVAFLLLSLYPISQIYQREEDTRRGDQTFTLQYGTTVVFRFFELSFLGGLVLITIVIIHLHTLLGILFGAIGLITGLIVRSNVKTLTAGKEDYSKVMRIKYGTSMAFVVFLLIGLIIKHSAINGISSVIHLLLK
ncbi:MAG TPA: UbiA family prenyltransferase [Balneolaceae bacterium]|nr:UbiA family prenyltransferase [Balneolaceae bacterium]